MKVQTKDYYRILQVWPGAEQGVIEAAYHRLLRKHQAYGDTAEGMRGIKEAYQVLSDPVARADYDASRRIQARPEDLPWRLAGVAPPVDALPLEQPEIDTTESPDRRELPLPLIAGVITFILVLLVAWTFLQSGGSEQPNLSEEPPAATEPVDAPPDAP